ncbi:MAG TPA: hypothetical protein VGR69_09670 [Candidatus Rubrimentiphilum sp.]|nr:hypothetical protein [Candidatus Rubrimentiphilum sp.]
MEARLPAASIGDGVCINSRHGSTYGSIISVARDIVCIALAGPNAGIAPGDLVRRDLAATRAPLGPSALGRAFNAAGNAIDGKKYQFVRRALRLQAPSPQYRRAVQQPLWTGICAIDALLTIGRGARIGVFGAPGTGKSSLLLSLMRDARTDAVVIGLVGERGREAEEWIAALPDYATIFCATSDRSAAERVSAARAAMAQAAELRTRGLNVLLILDSLARYAAAHREIAVAAAERVGRGGYPPRVFSELAAFTEIAGSCENGSITLVATILTDGDDRDPVSEAARALLDGHVQLSTELASAGKFPAIDILGSVSRTMNAVIIDSHRHDATMLREAIAELHRTREARAVGIMPAGDSTLRAVALEDRIDAFLYNPAGQDPGKTLSQLHDLAEALGEPEWNFQTA